MKLRRATLFPFRLHMTTPLATAHGTITRREGVLLRLEDAAGNEGWGESSPLPGFGLETLAEVEATLPRLVGALLEDDLQEIDSLLDAAEAAAPGSRSARGALDTALHDLLARRRSVPLAALFSAQPRSRLEVNALIGGTAPEEVAQRAKEACARGFRTLKLKVGTLSLDLDDARVAAARAAVGSDIRLRLDANGAWEENEAVRALVRLAAHDLEYVEQPVAPGDLACLARVRAASPVAIAADEAVTGLSAATALLEARAADLLVVKPAALGGLRPARRVAELARHSGVGVVVTSFLDSAVGAGAALQLAATLADPSRAVGIVPGALFSEDLADPAIVTDGRVDIPLDPGLGITPSGDALRRCARGAPREIAS